MKKVRLLSTLTLMPDIDFLVIGAGAAGAAVSWRLALGGAKVVCLEQGGWVLPESSPSLPHGNKPGNAVIIQIQTYE